MTCSMSLSPHFILNIIRVKLLPPSGVKIIEVVEFLSFKTALANLKRLLSKNYYPNIIIFNILKI